MESFQTVIPGPQSIWSWWVDKFPQSARVYGEPVHWNEPNLDFLASALGELPFGIVFYSPEDRFYFRDYIFESAYRPTEDEKLVVLAKKLVTESVAGTTRSFRETSRTLFLSAGEWVERAKSILVVEDNFFTGDGGRRRWIEGRYVEPVDLPTVSLFAESRIVHGKGHVLPFNEAYHLYYAYCREMGFPPVRKMLFKEIFSSEAKRRWKVGLRNDLKVDGKSQQGWGGLSVSLESVTSEVPNNAGKAGRQLLIADSEADAPLW